MWKKFRKSFSPFLLAALALTLVGAGGAFAWDGWGGGIGCGMGPGGGFGPGPRHLALANLTPEQAGQVFDLKQKFLNDTAELRKQMMIKAVELAQLWKAEKPDDKAILAKTKELSALRVQFMEKAVAHRLELKKIAPQLPMFGPGVGPGRGLGKGFGRGAALSAPQSLGEAESSPMADLVMNFTPDW